MTSQPSLQVTLPDAGTMMAALVAFSSDDRLRTHLYPLLVGWAGRTCSTEALVNYHLPTALLKAYGASSCNLPPFENPDSQFDLIDALIVDEVLREDARSRRMALWQQDGPPKG